MRGVVNDLFGGALFHDIAVQQHDDPVGHLGHNRQIMGDINRSGLLGFDDFLKRMQNLDLRCHVQRCCRLIKYHQLRIGQQSHRRHQPLQLAATDLMRIAPPDIFRIRQIQPAVQILRFFQCGGTIHDAVHPGNFAHLPVYRHRRVERSGGTLSHIGDPLAAQVAFFVIAEGQYILAVKQN